MQDSLPAGGLRLYREGVEPSGSLRKISGYISILLSRTFPVARVVYVKRLFGGPQQVLDYLGRYTHRVAIANNRLISLADGEVHFRWKDYRHPQRRKTMTLPAGEFIRRFLLHVLPDGFRRIRHFGFLANTHRSAKLVLIRGLLDLPEPETAPVPADYHARYAQLFERSLDICRACGGHFVEIAVLRRTPPAARSFSCDSSSPRHSPSLRVSDRPHCSRASTGRYCRLRPQMPRSPIPECPTTSLPSPKAASRRQNRLL